MTAGTNPAPTWGLTYSTGGSVQDPTTYKGLIDANFAVAQRVSDKFAPHPATPAAMSVVVDAGFVAIALPSGLLKITEVAQQTATIGAAPSAPNNRIDLVVVDAGSGTVSTIAGTPASSPSAPALTAGKLQICQVSVPNGTTAIGETNITDLRTVWGQEKPGVPWCTAGGTSDALTGTYTPATPTLGATTDGYLWRARAGAANTTTTPTWAPDGQGPWTIKKLAGAALVANDIAGAGHELLLSYTYNSGSPYIELLNPAVVLPSIAAGHVIGNSTGSTTTAADTTLTALIDEALGNTDNDVLQRVSGDWVATTLSAAIDNAIGSTRGSILERGSSGWTDLAPGTSGDVLTSNGSGADPSWQAGASTTYGAIGTYQMVDTTSIGTWTVNSTYSLSPGGTWRCMGTAHGANSVPVCCGNVTTNYEIGIFVRIA